MHILILKWINAKLGWFLTTRATTALLGPATESRRAVVRFGSRSLAIRKHLQQDVVRIHLHLNCRQWYLELLRYRSLPVASFPPYRWEESRALKDNESYTQIWEEYNGVPDDNNTKSARCKLGGSDSLIVLRVHLNYSLLRRGHLQSRLGKNIPAARGGWKEEKLKRAGNAGTPRCRFLSPALPLPFLSLVFTNRSLCGGESLNYLIEGK